MYIYGKSKILSKCDSCFQLKPVRSLENFKSTSPITTPERWIFPSRTGAPMASPPNRFLLSNHSQETQNLLQSPDDVFLSPPSVPPRNNNHIQQKDICSKDLFGSTPFVVGGGHNENGDPLFYVANHHSVDIVKLSPPTCSPRRKVIGLCLINYRTTRTFICTNVVCG